jgi:hypothetical protein
LSDQTPAGLGRTLLAGDTCTADAAVDAAATSFQLIYDASGAPSSVCFQINTTRTCDAAGGERCCLSSSPPLPKPISFNYLVLTSPNQACLASDALKVTRWVVYL